jgi:hypothetical protein
MIPYLKVMVRRLGTIVPLFLCLAAGAATTVDITYTFTDFQLTAAAVRRVTQTPLQPFADYNGAILTAAPSVQVTSGAGSVTFSNSVPGYSYRVQIDTPYGSTIRTCGVPVTASGAINGRDYLGEIKGERFYYLYTQPGTLTSTNTGTAGQVFAWLTSGTGYWANASALPGSQSPLVQNVNGAQYQVTNLATVQMTNLVIKGPNGSTIFREYPSQHSGFSNELQLSTFELGAGLYVGLGFANPVAWMTTDGDIVSKIGRFWGNGGGLTNVPSASNATNFWGSLSPTNLPAGIATSNYVGTFWLTMDRLTNGAPPPSVIWRPAANRPAMMSYDTFTDSAQFAPNDMGLAANRAACAESNLLAVAISFNTNNIPVEWIELQDGWEATARNAAGELMWEPTLYPNGLPNTISNLHYLGKKVRLYTSFSTLSDDPSVATTCLGLPATTFRTVQRDLQLWASWGVDGFFFDNCNDIYSSTTSVNTQFMRNRAIANAVVATGRDLDIWAAVLSGYPHRVGNGAVDGTDLPLNWEVPRLMNAWPDGAENWSPYLPGPNVTWLKMSNIIWGAWITRSGTLGNSPTNVGPGHTGWFAFFSPQDAYQCNDVMGNVIKTEVSASVMSLNPISIGNPTRPEFSTISYTNWQNAAVNQYLYDPAMLSGSRAVSNNLGALWTRPIGGTNTTTNLVWMVNWATNAAQTLSYTTSMSGWAATETFSAFELWSGTDYGVFSNNFSVSVPTNANYIFRVVKVPMFVTNTLSASQFQTSGGRYTIGTFSSSPFFLQDGLNFATGDNSILSVPPDTTNCFVDGFWLLDQTAAANGNQSFFTNAFTCWRYENAPSGRTSDNTAQQTVLIPATVL